MSANGVLTAAATTTRPDAGASVVRTPTVPWWLGLSASCRGVEGLGIALLTPPQDPAAVAKAVLAPYGDMELRRCFGDEARFSIDVRLSRLVEIYESVVERRS